VIDIPDQKKSFLVKFFGDYPIIKVLDFLLENRIFDYSKTEICEHTGIAWPTLQLFWKRLESMGIVKPTRAIGRAKMYALSTENPVVKKLIEFDFKISAYYGMKIVERELKIPVSI